MLLIDEAYSLTRGGENDFGREAIDAVVKQVEDRRSSMVVILAGYPREMAELVASNPGFESRFPRTILFPDYANDELVQILDTAFTATNKAPMSPLRRRDYIFTIAGEISVSYGGGQEIQQEVTERALWYLGEVSDYLQDAGVSPSTQINLGGAVQWARVTDAVIHEADGLNDDDDITGGRTTTIAFAITGLIRA